MFIAAIAAVSPDTHRTIRCWFRFSVRSEEGFWRCRACWRARSAFGRCVESPPPAHPLGELSAWFWHLTVVIVPMFAPYNQVLLAPAILALLWSESSGEPILPAIRLARIIGGILLAWPWIATVGLTLGLRLAYAVRFEAEGCDRAVLFQLHAARIHLRIGAAGHMDDSRGTNRVACGRARQQSSLRMQQSMLSCALPVAASDG